MFGATKKSGNPLGIEKVQTIIGEGTEVRGNIQSTGVVRVDGYLEGTVDHNGDLIIGPKGRLQANVKSKGLAIAGEIRGDVDIEGKLELLPGSRLFGDIRCGHLVVHDGAMFHGTSRMAATDPPPELTGQSTPLMGDAKGHQRTGKPGGK